MAGERVSASRPQSERHGMVGIRRDDDLGQNRRVVGEADLKFLDQHGEYQADFGEREPGADTDAGARWRPPLLAASSLILEHLASPHMRTGGSCCLPAQRTCPR